MLMVDTAGIVSESEGAVWRGGDSQITMAAITGGGRESASAGSAAWCRLAVSLHYFSTLFARLATRLSVALL